MTDILETLREIHGTATLGAISAFLLGIVFDVVAEISRYCTRAAVAEWASPSDVTTGGKHTLAVLSAMLVAFSGTQALHFAGLIDLSEAIYWSQTIKPVALVVGGVLFGIGMVLAGGCVSRLLVLAASGNGRSWVTLLVAAISAYATLRGLLSYPRIWLEGTSHTQVTSEAQIGESSVVVAAAIALVLLVFMGAISRGRMAGKGAFDAGAAIGLTVLLGWFVTGIVGTDDFEPTQLASLSFVASVGESLQYLMIFTGDSIRFSIALVVGVLVGALVSSISGGRFAFKGFTNESSLFRYASGCVLIGFGGVTALGCTIGNGCQASAPHPRPRYSQLPPSSQRRS